MDFPYTKRHVPAGQTTQDDEERGVSKSSADAPPCARMRNRADKYAGDRKTEGPGLCEKRQMTARLSF
jgi:hypothetical protein